MEVPGGKQNKLKVCLYEALGTAFLITAINWSASKPELQSQTIGLSITISALILGGVSGGHFNPAITMAVFVKERNNKIK